MSIILPEISKHAETLASQTMLRDDMKRVLWGFKPSYYLSHNGYGLMPKTESRKKNYVGEGTVFQKPYC